MNDYVDKLWNSDAVACLDALKEADEAVETINKDMFSIIADVAADVVADNKDPLDGDQYNDQANFLKGVLKEFEKRYKGERSLKHMPGSYRSAKSTIVNAVKHGINLFDSIDGKLKGKSALEKEINQTKKQRPQPEQIAVDPSQPLELYLNVVFKELKRAASAESVEDDSNAQMYVDRIREQLDEIEEKLIARP